MKTKLIMVEGIPGAGKSSTAGFVAEYLRSQGVQCELFNEGNLDHPADFESVACFTPLQFEGFVGEYAKYEGVLRKAVVDKGQNLFLPYRKLAKEVNLPENLISAISKFDVYELPSDKYCDVLLQKWDAIATSQAEKDTVVIFECCFLQNALSHLFIRNDEDKKYILSHLLHVSGTIKKLDPTLIYLNPMDVQEAINKVSKERSTEWLDFVIWYHTQQGYGKKRGLNGIDGYVEVLEARQSLELDILNNIPFHVLQIDNPQNDWLKTHQQIQEYINV